jgi:hypothetical protein
VNSEGTTSCTTCRSAPRLGGGEQQGQPEGQAQRPEQQARLLALFGAAGVAEPEGLRPHAHQRDEYPEVQH